MIGRDEIGHFSLAALITEHLSRDNYLSSDLIPQHIDQEFKIQYEIAGLLRYTA